MLDNVVLCPLGIGAFGGRDVKALQPILRGVLHTGGSVPGRLLAN